MTITATDKPGEVFADFSQEELAILSNCLNEVLNGFGTSGHDGVLGASADRISWLLSVIHDSAISGTGGTITLNGQDLVTLAEVVQLAVSELGTEFSIRAGFSIGEAQNLVGEIKRHIRGS